MTDKPRSRGRPRNKDRAGSDPRHDLIRSGLELLTQNGFLSTGIDAIVRNANVPKGSFYYYFPSKEEYASAVLSSYDSFFEYKLKKHLCDGNYTPVERMDNFITDACSGMEKYSFTRGCLVGNMMQESAGLPVFFIGKLREILKNWQTIVSLCLGEALQSGEIISKFDSIKLAEIFWSGWEGAVMQAKIYRSAQPITDFWDYFKASVRYLRRPDDCGV
ncbi:TetR family transcriptional regulator [Pantoea agglomerans]|nr:TetR/AcrR family transcriptional regulator [Pantoea agglomerans]PEI05549.1 TetR family transcriptional regulator [Pantoea agglomerans]